MMGEQEAVNLCNSISSVVYQDCTSLCCMCACYHALFFLFISPTCMSTVLSEAVHPLANPVRAFGCVSVFPAHCVFARTRVRNLFSPGPRSERPDVHCMHCLPSHASLSFSLTHEKTFYIVHKATCVLQPVHLITSLLGAGSFIQTDKMEQTFLSKNLEREPSMNKPTET